MKKISILPLLFGAFAALPSFGADCDYSLEIPDQYFTAKDAQNLESTLREKGFDQIGRASPQSKQILYVSYGAPYIPVLGGRRFVEVSLVDRELGCSDRESPKKTAYTCTLFKDVQKAAPFEGPGRMLKKVANGKGVPTCSSLSAAREKCEADYEKYCK